MHVFKVKKLPMYDNFLLGKTASIPASLLVPVPLHDQNKQCSGWPPDGTLHWLPLNAILYITHL